MFESVVNQVMICYGFFVALYFLRIFDKTFIIFLDFICSDVCFTIRIEKAPFSILA